MAGYIKVPPSATSLCESMRDIGYSVESAIADIIDNSVSAKSKNIDVYHRVNCEEPVVAIVDDGVGMTKDELLNAMKHGSKNPKDKRNSHDLGRFGLGLKTASFSQARKLTVITKKEGSVSAAEWDLDLVEEKDEWIIKIFSDNEINSLPFIERLVADGTIIIWRKLDRLFEDKKGDLREQIVNEKMDIVEKHLSLVFHRFLEGEFNNSKFKISINNHIVKPFDPFCRKNKATQLLPLEAVGVGDEKIIIQPYILPHHSKLTPSEYEYYKTRSDFLSNQGVYVYRNGRLMVWGDWFRIIPKNEATKLARVRVDFPNSLDDKWSIDIRKSKARPPHEVREAIRNIIQRVMHGSVAVHRKRGTKLYDDIRAPVWERFASHEGVRYALNRSHPFFENLENKLDEESRRSFGLLLEMIESAVPVEMIYSDYSSSPVDFVQVGNGDDGVEKKLALLLESFGGINSITRDDFLDIVRSTRLFDGRYQFVNKFLDKEYCET